MGNQKDDKVYDIQLFRQKHIQPQPQPQPHQISGETANFSGIYRLLHAKHPVAGELVVLKGSKFPSCGACNEPITFTLIRQADEIAKVVEAAMCAAGAEYVKRVPVKVETQVADEWVK